MFVQCILILLNSNQLEVSVLILSPFAYYLCFTLKVTQTFGILYFAVDTCRSVTSIRCWFMRDNFAYSHHVIVLLDLFHSNFVFNEHCRTILFWVFFSVFDSHFFLLFFLLRNPVLWNMHTYAYIKQWEKTPRILVTRIIIFEVLIFYENWKRRSCDVLLV